MSAHKLHVLFSPSAAGTLKQALQIMGRSDEVLCLFDNFSFGPIATDDGNARTRWVEKHLGYSDDEDVAGDVVRFMTAFETLALPITAWVSKRETMTYAGFLWWLSHLGNAPVSVVELEELSITNAEGMIEFVDRAVPLLDESRQKYRARWEELKLKNAPLRVIAGTDLISAELDYFDSRLLGHATYEWQKIAFIVARLLFEFMETGVYQTGDLVLGARLADLAEAGKLEWRGDLSHMRRCELRLPAAR
jgi:hypothetical protein